MELNNQIKVIESQLRSIYAQIVWTHKIQEKQADIYRKKQSCLEVTRIVISSLTTSGIITSIFIDSTWVKILISIISFISVLINSYLKSYDLAKLAADHKNSALKALYVRNRLSSTLTDIKIGNISLDSLTDIRDQYIDEIEDVYKGCKDASDKAVEMARISLTKLHDNTFTNEEIDSYLPVYARKVVADESRK